MVEEMLGVELVRAVVLEDPEDCTELLNVVFGLVVAVADLLTDGVLFDDEATVVDLVPETVVLEDPTVVDLVAEVL